MPFNLNPDTVVKLLLAGLLAFGVCLFVGPCTPTDSGGCKDGVCPVPQPVVPQPKPPAPSPKKPGPRPRPRP